MASTPAPPFSDNEQNAPHAPAHIVARLGNLADRDKEIRAAYNRLRCEEQLMPYAGRKVAIRLSYQQCLILLSKKYYLSTRRVEYIIGQTEPQMSPLTTSTP
jgi:hypothetical protein